MTNIIFTILAILVALIVVPIASAQETANGSAVIESPIVDAQSSEIDPQELTLKKMVITRVLERYNSPLRGTVDGFIDTCMTYDLDCYLLPSISGVESTFGKFIAPGTYNPFGWGGGYIEFSSWEDGYDAVGKGLRENYLNKGAQNVHDIGKIYAANPEWGTKVSYFLAEFEEEEAKLRLYFE